MPQELAHIRNLDQAREFFRERGLYAGNRNLFSDRDLYVGLLHEGEDFDRVEDAFYLYMEDGKWVTRVTPEGGEPVISRYASFKDVWQAQYPDSDAAEFVTPIEEHQAAQHEASDKEEPVSASSESSERKGERAIPEGFEGLFRTSPFLELLGPFYNKLTGEELVFGFYVKEKHCNSRGIVHGGVLSSLADVALGSNAVIARDEPKPLVTVNLSVDYADAAQLGDWIEVHTDVQKVGSKVAFANCYFLVGSRPIARASAVFSVVES